MTKVMGLTGHVYGCVSIIWLFSAVVCVTQAVELHAPSLALARCGVILPLPCRASSSRSLDIKLFSWLARDKTVCKHTPGGPKLEDACTNSPPEELTLTLNNVMPVDAGTYLCKIRTTMGANGTKTVVKVQDCLENSTISINGSHARCGFNGVYPRGIVHWSQGGDNLTGSARTEDKENPDGRYDVWSTIDVENRKLNLSYHCCLQIPSTGKEYPCQMLTPTSTGNIVKLQWICTMVGILMAKLII